MGFHRCTMPSTTQASVPHSSWLYRDEWVHRHRPTSPRFNPPPKLPCPIHRRCPKSDHTTNSGAPCLAFETWVAGCWLLVVGDGLYIGEDESWCGCGCWLLSLSKVMENREERNEMGCRFLWVRCSFFFADCSFFV